MISFCLWWCDEFGGHNGLTLFFFQRNIASQGGQASSGSFQPGDPRARAAGQKGGSRTQYDQYDEPEE